MNETQAILRIGRIMGEGDAGNRYAGCTAKIVQVGSSVSVEVHDRRGVGHNPTNPNPGTYRTTYSSAVTFDGDYAA